MPSPQQLRAKYAGLADRYFKLPPGSRERRSTGRLLDLAHAALRPPRKPKPSPDPPPVLRPHLTPAAYALITRARNPGPVSPRQPCLTRYARSLIAALDYPREPGTDAILAAHRVLLGERVAGLTEELSNY